MIQISKIATGQGDNYTTGCFLDYNYFKNYYKMVSMDLHKQQAIDADPKSTQQINFTGYLAQEVIMSLLLKTQKELFQIFHKKF